MNYFGQGQGQGQPSNQGLEQGFGQGIGDKISSGLNSLGSGLSSGLSSVTSGFGQGQGTPTPSVGFNSFYTTVVAIAVIILILVLAFLGWTMSKQKDTDNFPKLQTTCPDYWGITADGKCTQPAQGQVNSGDDKASTDAPGFSDSKFDFANAGWSAGGNAVCQKKKWANKHTINWDTVTNANYC